MEMIDSKSIENEKNEQPTPTPAPTPKRGFAVMDPTRVREIARRGGKAAHANGTAHRFTSDEARTAGKKGGEAPHRVRGARRGTAQQASS